ncbi:hypothetical protein [Streptomyces sp. NPDC093707]|uniref:hypothetical protein n=1 Tax=Streptomyces sp. NPDC093707 TaxID=3154984 RepID=UPI00344D7299
MTSSHAGTAAAREWWFTLHPTERPTDEQADQFCHSDVLASGEIGWEQDPNGVCFPCTVEAPCLEDAVTWAAARLRQEIGVELVRVEIEMKMFG